jgi:ribulose 1,5-bisphosphate synthetase/thiazole synthase
MNTRLQSQIDVLIVGAGPTGLTLACEGSVLDLLFRSKLVDKIHSD